MGSINDSLTMNGGTYDLNGNTGLGCANFNGATSAQLVNNGTNNVTYVIGNNNGTGGNFQGVIADHTTGTGTISLTKVLSGTLTLSGANTYTGNTTVNGGTLIITQPTFATNSTVTVAGGAFLQLDFSATNTVAGLVLNGVSQAPGIYDSTSGSPNITGSGALNVVPLVASNPTNIIYSVSGNTLNLSWPADHLGWLLQSNSINLAISNDWFDITNTATVTNYSITVDATMTNVFYRMRKP